MPSEGDSCFQGFQNVVAAARVAILSESHVTRV